MPQTKADLIEQLGAVQRALTETVHEMSPARFSHQPGVGWSAAEYLKHLLLSNKPFVKAMGFSADQLARRFGTSDRPSVSYDELTAKYDARLAEGVKAEDYEKVVPSSFRMPEAVEDEKAYLLDLWNDSHNRLFAALQNWQEADLDKHQLPHPAIGVITLREMLFFTLYHNTLHWHDIQQVSSQTAV